MTSPIANICVPFNGRPKIISIFDLYDMKKKQ